MADTLTRSERSALMSKIRSEGNRSTELRLIQIFRAHKITGWRRNFPLIGKPDFVFPKAHLCVFVDGCFWHGCPKCYRRPKSKRIFWRKKVAMNQTRDKAVVRELRRLGWRVVRFWECRLQIEVSVYKKVVRQMKPDSG
jgi:DNA mismatch endonuclease (patch repair protein)